MKTCTIITWRDGTVEDVVNIVGDDAGRILPGGLYSGQPITTVARTVFGERAIEINPGVSVGEVDDAFDDGVFEHGDSELIAFFPQTVIN
jgi:hypothetical protein